MKNEGPFVLEWIAYHKAIGFSDIYVVTNDCTDGTDLILQRLHQYGVVHHLDQTLSPDEKPQLKGIKTVMGLPQMAQTNWLLHIDADEFLRVSVGKGHVQDLLKICSHADNIALLWRPFGSAGHSFWRGGSVLRAFLCCQRHPRSANAGHKSMFRPNKFAYATDHMPKSPFEAGVLSVNSTGTKIKGAAVNHPTRSRYRLPSEHLTWDVACIHHYAVRSQDVFLMKNDRGDGMARGHRKYFLGSNFYRRHNRNATKDVGMLDHVDAVDALVSEWLQDSELRRLEQNALRAFQDRRDQFLTPQRIKDLTI
ncbi:glycosyltransferase family 2 protein [Ruegeria sp. R13_0]|uniref:glycosyltransferase family 2 protein n=1 Tax=Ruegeria sp. R13_0 TaxID=2821099 RepID=UPI001ADAB301|nr:glycosyltransferase family 2 protein [Ruegeria sp. R13_0]MBO9433925.1 glycosyltransferase family 2 protein [Ruegeria sp. R13_0]